MISTQIIFVCLEVFCCRIMDVTLSTLRTVVTVKGKNKLAAMIGLVEVFIWFMVVRDALNVETTSLMEKLNVAIAYACGFSIGTFVGCTLSQKIPGKIEMQVVTSKEDPKIIEEMQKAGYELTVMKSEPTQFSKEKYMIISVISNKNLNDFKKLVYSLDENAFISYSEAKGIYYGEQSLRKK